MRPIAGFHHVCVKTRDWDATLRFYRDTLGCTLKIAWREAPQRAVMLDGQGKVDFPVTTPKPEAAKFTINWTKDRGRNPDGSERLNDLHFTRAQKEAARRQGARG